jgi:tetratricopeptide (TPR) repeat protein
MSLPLPLKEQIQNYKIPFDAPLMDVQTDELSKTCRRTRDILETLEKKYKVDPSNKELIHALAIVNYARGFFVRAEKLFIDAKELDPNNADIPYNFGIFYYDAHRHRQTESEWLLSLRLNPSLGNAYLNLAYLYYEQGDFEKAWTNCQLALKQGTIVSNELIKEIKSKNNL